ncbi:MAG: hypothetical protein RTU92_14510 [Candidatus Thorarchaeota archaeon]
MNKKRSDMTLNKHNIEQLQIKQRAEFEAPKTRLAHMEDRLVEVVKELVKRETDSNEVDLRFTLDKPPMMRLFNICNFLNCS